jgi:uncharacterized cupredoxin-like copper-binding protein
VPFRTVLAAAMLAAGATGVAPAHQATAVVPITIHHSRFVPAQISVRAGTRVRFVVVNTDPIDHEFLVGDQAVQDRHELGTEAHHGARPGEVSVGAGETRTTTIEVTRQLGPIMYGCHLPGHWAYGMKGVIDLG